MCCNLFLTKSELVDRRPFAVCVNGDTICADCYNECRKRPNGKCPTCGDDLVQTPIINKTLMGLIGNCASVLEISVKKIEMEKKPFASGAFGQVYKGKWREKDVVIKVMNADSEDERQAIKNEANITLRLNHKNIIKLFGIICVKDEPLGIVMEMTEHDSLDKWIGKMYYDQLRKTALGIISGLKYVHSQHVIHRDIKHQNILMFGPKDDMIPKISDFGVSKVIQTVMMTHGKVGQELYMAPEVRLNLPYGFTADIYSLTMMLFEMFNKQLISKSSDEVQRFITSVHSGRFGKIPETCEVPEYLRDVIKRGWSDSPEERPLLDEFYSTIRG